MGKKLFALLPGLALLLTLLAVTAWGSSRIAPDATVENLTPNIIIKINCTTKDDHSLSVTIHPWQLISSKDATLTQKGEGRATLTINSAKVLEAYHESWRGTYGTHIVDGSNVMEIELEYDRVGEKYMKSSSQEPSITVMCLRPDNLAVQRLMGTVTLQCTNDNNHKYEYSFGEVPRTDTYSVALVREENGVYYCTLTVNADVFREFMLSNDSHRLTGDTTRDFAVQYDSVKKEWSLADPTEKNPTFTMTCTPLAVPTYPELLGIYPNGLKARIYPTTGDISDPYFTLTEEMIDFKNENAKVEQDYLGDYYCRIPLKEDTLIKAFNAKGGYLLLNCGYIRLKLENGSWRPDNEVDIYAAPAPTVEELGLSANVVCADGRHTLRAYTPAKDQLTLTPVWDEDENCYMYRVSLSSSAADRLVARYSTDVGKTHTRQTVSTVTIYWHSDGDPGLLSLENGVAVQAETEPPAQSEGWCLDSKIISITAKCDKSVIIPAEDKKITSAKTFDAGIAAYMGLSILSAAGTAVVFRKKRQQ